MRVVYSPRHLGHEITLQTVLGVQVPANEVADRAERIRRTLVADGGFTLREPTEHGEAPITAVHDPGLLAFLRDAWAEARRVGFPHAGLAPETIRSLFATEGMSAGVLREPPHIYGRAGHRALDTSTYIVAGTYDAARAAVDVALTAVDLVLDGGEAAAYGLCRPPGHHASRSLYGGYCFLNNAAIAAHHLVTATGGKVAVLDVDYHHGNGSQQIFYDRDDVLYVSLHGDPARAYPYSVGFADEIGTGRGRGCNLNIPLPEATGDDDYLDALGRALDRIAGFDPEAVVVSLGLDTFVTDPICDLALTADGFERCGAAVAGLGRPTVVVQEGGYDVDALGENVRRWLSGLEG